VQNVYGLCIEPDVRAVSFFCARRTADVQIRASELDARWSEITTVLQAVVLRSHWKFGLALFVWTRSLSNY